MTIQLVERLDIFWSELVLYNRINRRGQFVIILRDSLAGVILGAVGLHNGFPVEGWSAWMLLFWVLHRFKFDKSYTEIFPPSAGTHAVPYNDLTLYSFPERPQQSLEPLIEPFALNEGFGIRRRIYCNAGREWPQYNLPRVFIAITEHHGGEWPSTDAWWTLIIMQTGSMRWSRLRLRQFRCRGGYFWAPTGPWAFHIW